MYIIDLASRPDTHTHTNTHTNTYTNTYTQTHTFTNTHIPRLKKFQGTQAKDQCVPAWFKNSVNISYA